MSKIEAVFAYLLLFFSIVCAALLAVVTQDAYIFNRMGATVCALGAVAVCVQVARELRLESESQVDLITILSGRLPPSAFDRALVALPKRFEERHSFRKRIVFFVGTLLFLGELIHGWGDYLLLQIGLIEFSSKG